MMQVLERLEEIFAQQVFELCGPFESESGTVYCIPYMMNDALEDYLVLKECRMIGTYLKDSKLHQEMQWAKQENGYVLAVRQGEENAFTIYFKEIEESVRFYQYHEIGHFWVKGQEQWRQLVYMLGTMYDKFEYLGEQGCNEWERALLPLMHFGPLIAWSPIHTSLLEEYQESEEGLLCMEALAREAGDWEYVRWIRGYFKFPCGILRSHLQRMLINPRREPLYRLLFEKIEAASGAYPKRRYEPAVEGEMESMREHIRSKLKQEGYQGCYPLYHKGNRSVYVTEEHPFTIMEWEHYRFRVQLMRSECEDGVQAGRNSGFFKRRGRKGWVETYDEY